LQNLGGKSDYLKGNSMIKTILVPATGNETDAGVFGSALAVARPFGAHLDFLHVRVDAATFAATIMPEVGSAQVVTDLINKMDEEGAQREQKTKQLFESFCQRDGLALAGTPPAPSAPSATWLREIGSEAYWLVEYARAADLLIIGRPSDDQIAPSDVLESALLNSGRPLLIPPSGPMSVLPDTVVIAWKATPEAARAVTAAMPFLAITKQIVIMTVAEDETTMEEEGAARLMASLRWHGFPVSVRRLEPNAQGAAETLLAAAREQGALVVMGGYGHSRLREWIFGGFTQRILHEAEIPVLIAH
jgi:nucleotide-binding universal stress UspA family protein